MASDRERRAVPRGQDGWVPLWRWTERWDWEDGMQEVEESDTEKR
jgi:hypothetical protein